MCGTNNAVKTGPQLAPLTAVQGQPETDAEVQFAAMLLFAAQHVNCRVPQQRVTVNCFAQTDDGTTGAWRQRRLFCLLIAQIFAQALNGELMAHTGGGAGAGQGGGTKRPQYKFKY